MDDEKIGFCYAVLTTSGVCKFGRTKDACGRIKHHAHIAEGFGLEVERVFLTEQVENCYDLERDIFSVAGQGMAGKREFCPGFDRGRVEEVFRRCGVRFNSGNRVSRGRAAGEVVFHENAYRIEGNQKGARLKARDEAEIRPKLIGYVEKMQPVTLGKLTNRIRNMANEDVAAIVRKMVADEEIERVDHTHRRHGVSITKYVLPGYQEADDS